MAGGGLQPQPASGEELEMMGEDISHIDQNEHHRNLKIPYGSLDPAATVAGSALKGCSPCLMNQCSLCGTGMLGRCSALVFVVLLKFDV
jgi:hypothetical protein